MNCGIIAILMASVILRYNTISNYYRLSVCFIRIFLFSIEIQWGNIVMSSNNSTIKESNSVQPYK